MHLRGVQDMVKGYNTGVVDTDEHSDTPHDARPLPLELVRLSQVAVETGIQQADNSCKKSTKKGNKQSWIVPDKQNFSGIKIGQTVS